MSTPIDDRIRQPLEKISPLGNYLSFLGHGVGFVNADSGLHGRPNGPTNLGSV